jgi:SAM-dependent methyltransferase
VCPLCSGGLNTPARKVSDPITGEKFEIACCSECRIAMTVPAPARIETYYRERYYGNRHSFTGRLCNWRRRRLVARHISPSAGARLLDLGSGDGAFLDTASAAGWTAVGVEPHHRPDEGKHAIFRTLEQAATLAPYDCVTMWHVLEHVPAPVECLAQLRSILSPTGVLLLAVPDFGGLQARVFGGHWLHLDVPRHLYHFTARSLPRLLNTAGFEVLRTAHQEFEYDCFGWIQSALNAIGPTPNVLFDALTGKPPRVGRFAVGAAYVAGSLIAPAAAALTAASTLLHRGGTIIVAARPRPR